MADKNACEHGHSYDADSACYECVSQIAEALREKEIPNCIHEKPFNKCGFCSTSDWQA